MKKLKVVIIGGFDQESLEAAIIAKENQVTNTKGMLEVDFIRLPICSDEGKEMDVPFAIFEWKDGSKIISLRRALSSIFREIEALFIQYKQIFYRDSHANCSYIVVLHT